MAWLDHKVPPPLVALAVWLAMWPLSAALPQVELSTTARLAGAVGIGGLGLAFSVAGALAFRAAATTVNPLRPDKATSLVTSGVYRITRNPMYLGLMLVLLGWVAWLASPLSLAGPVAFIAYSNRFQIGPEERFLRARFGAEFESYVAKVRRWL